MRHSIAAVVRQTGIGADTIRAWERRHRLVEPLRESSGARVYSDRDVRRLLLARDASRLGFAIRHIAALDDDALRRLIAERSPQMAFEAENDPAAHTVSETFDAVERFDFVTAQRCLTGAALLLPRDEFVLRVAAPLLRRIGEAWSAERLSIAQEHAVSQLVRNLAGSLSLQSGTLFAERSMLFAAPPGERHEFGMMLASLLAAGRGNAVSVFGSDLPAEEVGRAAREVDAHTVVIATMADARDAGAIAFVRELRGALGNRALWVGGPNVDALCAHRDLRAVEPIATLEAFANRVALAGQR